LLSHDRGYKGELYGGRKEQIIWRAGNKGKYREEELSMPN